MTDAKLLAAIKRYREAYFAYETWNMRLHRDYERARRKRDFDPEASDLDRDAKRDDEGRQLRRALDDAKYDLVKSPPAEFAALCKAMRKEFGE